MAKYAYAPLSIEENRKKNSGNNYYDNPEDHGGGGGGGGRDDSDNLVQERMPLCVGVCVLLAIVYVLARTGDREDLMNSFEKKNLNNPNSAEDHNNFRSSASTTTPQGQVLNQVANEMKAATAAGELERPVDLMTTTTSSSSNSNFVDSVPATTYSGVNFIDDTSSVLTTSTAATTGTASECPPPPKCPEQPAVAASTADLSGMDSNALMGKLRADALAKTPPHIIECAKAEAGESQSACHLPNKDRFVALNQKGATLWMTGCSGAGKTTIATALEEKLIKEYGKHVYRLDGDNLRTGINRDLGFSESDRAESVRRTGELATLFSDSGVITLVGLISPYRKDRDMVRERHEQQNIPFYEIFLDVPVDELKNRDPKGQYARVESGELKHFTCIDDPYEEPLKPEITLKTHELKIEESVNMLFQQLERDGILIGPPKVLPDSSLPNPDGDEIVDLHVPEHLVAQRKEEAKTLPQVLINNIDLNWLQVIGEGWAAPLKGFMREGALLETLHFNSILTDTFNITGNKDRIHSKTQFSNFPETLPPNRISMSVPITLSITSFTKDLIEKYSSGAEAVALVTQMGKTVAILRNPEIYNNRKEEIVTRMFGVIDMDHPYIHHIYSGGDYLIGGEVELLERIKYNDGLDVWRKTTKELYAEFQAKNADTVYAFQTRNPTHAGHAYLMKSAGEDLKKNGGYKNPVLWLSPLGGWTKPDDVPLDVRVKQHEEVLNSGTSHPGGLDPDTTVMAIWPAPMVYAGPTEVEFHAKSRRNAGASYFVVGRDPAGMKGSPNAVAHPDDDLYDGNHGRYVLQNSPGIGNMKMLSFVKVMYDVTDNVMKVPDESRMDDFISISGSKMRLLARNGASLCSPDHIPTDLVEANCVPSGFMVPKGWDLVVDYYKNVQDKTRWIPWSQPVVLEPPINAGTSKVVDESGKLGSTEFKLQATGYDSWWHSPPIKASATDDTIINFVVEIPMHMTTKMEVSKELPHNAISQDTNKDGSPRYYTYGTPFFNYGMIPQTWEDPNVSTTLDGENYFGDNDPLDVIELGSHAYRMGSIVPCRVLGAMILIDEGETDYKILCLGQDDPENVNIRTLDELFAKKPNVHAQLIDWLTRYKTSDGKPENKLSPVDGTPKSQAEAMQIINETHIRWKVLCGHEVDSKTGQKYDPSEHKFWLNSPSCRGE